MGIVSVQYSIVDSDAFKCGFMADVSILGHIEEIRYIENGILVRISEVRAGYRRKDGTVVKDEVLLFRVMYKSFLRKYIEQYFGIGSLVKAKGVLLPYYKTGDGEIREGVTILGQTLDIASYPSRDAVRDKRVLKDSTGVDMGEPDLDGFSEDVF